LYIALGQLFIAYSHAKHEKMQQNN